PVAVHLHDDARGDVAQPAREERRGGVVRRLADNRLRPQLAQELRDAPGQREPERDAVEPAHAQRPDEREHGVGRRRALGGGREHVQVELVAEGVELAGEARRERQPVTRPADEQDFRASHAARVRSSVCSSIPKTRSREYDSTEGAAAARSRERSSASAKNRRIASASAAASPTGTSSPFSPSRTTSATPPVAVAITGVPTASASTTVCGKFSQLDESSDASAAAKSSSTPCRGSGPRSRTRSPSPSSPTARSTAPRSSPSPAIANETSGSAATASRATRSDFCGARRPAKASAGPSRP